LQRLNRIQPKLKNHGIQIIGISKNTVEQAGLQQTRDQISIPLLSDPNLVYTDQLGLVHRSGLKFITFYMMGIPLGFPTRFQKLPLPTTLLVDENSIIRWVEQDVDYRLRGSSRNIEIAISEIFKNAAASG